MCADVLTSDSSTGSRNGKRFGKVSKTRRPLQQRKLLVEQLESRLLLAFTAN